MNINRNLLYVTKKFPTLPGMLVIHKFIRSNSHLSVSNRSRIFYQNLQNEVHLKHSRVLPIQTPFCLYSSAVIEEQVIKKHPAPVITIPPLQFENVEFEKPISHSYLCDELQVCESLEEQMTKLASTLALSSDDIEKRTKFCETLETLFQPFFGKIKIQMFGSTVNGFGFKGCDVDMSFETFAEKKKEISYLETPDVPLVSEVMCGKVTPEEISLLPRREQLLFIHTVLLEFYKESAEPIIFISANISLVRFYHDKYNLKCDLSCSNRTAFANTKLMYLFGKLDERVIPLMMTIRYWAKHVELIGKGLLFNTYTISMLVIHFLQTRNPPVLPSAEHIISISNSLEIDDMNDNSFLDIRKSLPPSENTQTLAELLRDFFFFYLYFDYTRVICPFIGGSVPRDKFFSNLPNKKFKMNTICVQDPMLLSHNIAELVDYKSCKKLVSELMSVCRIFQDNSNLNPSSSKWGLLTMLDKSEEYVHQSHLKQNNVCFTIPLITRLTDKHVCENRNLFSAETLLYLLQHILLFECQSLQVSDVLQMLKEHDEVTERQRKIQEIYDQRASAISEVTSKLRKNLKSKYLYEKRNVSNKLMLEDFNKFNVQHELVLCAECKVLKNIWLGRDFISVESLPLNSINDFIEKERYVSINAAKQNELNSMDGKIKPFTFFYEAYLSNNGAESSLLINFRPFQRTNFNPLLGIFLKEYIPKLVNDINRKC